jgi:phytoene dehydrogenase-like protein
MAQRAIVVGSGPNGLAAAIVLAQAGCAVSVLEAAETPGGGVRSAELTLPGFIHDHCAAVFPLTRLSPFFRSLPLEQFGLEWVYSPVECAHPFDDAPAALAFRSVDETAAALGEDGPAYRNLYGYYVENFERMVDDLLGPLPLPPRSPLLLARFGLHALQPASWLARRFSGPRASGLLAGMAGHAILPLEKIGTGAYALMITVSAHAVGWPIPRGGAQKLTEALTGLLRSLGGEVVTGERVRSLKELPSGGPILLDVAPRQFIRIAGNSMPSGYRRQLEKFRYGPGVFKADFALDGPVPWRDPACAQTMTLHLGSAFAEIAAAERQVAQGIHPEHPYVLVSQPSLFDPTRAPQGRHTLWAYCHVPNGSTVDMTENIIAQIERYAPGFRQAILAVSTCNAQQMEVYNPNYVGGDIIAGAQDLAQHFTRPLPALSPYTTPIKNVYLCSSSTPPGGGVHGMCGYHAARAALRRM